MYKTVTAFLNFFPGIYGCLKIHQLNIVKITMNDHKKTRERYQSFSKEQKEKKQQ